MGKVDYDERLHAVYDAGRQMSPDARRAWTEAFARHLPVTRPLVWLDMGSGTGRLTPALATSFGGPVHGVEPSDRMRARATAHAGHPAGFARIDAALPTLDDGPQSETNELLVFER
jgi:ubiquinone/menaquinone biosynthesis C-methylase UbiE